MRRPPASRGWQDVRDEVLARIRARRWPPGTLLPGEAALAAELGCARTTVNRALQALADEGLLERRRRAGTRVVVHPERKTTLSIPLIRREIEARGHAYGYTLLGRRRERVPAAVRGRMRLGAGARLLHVRALHAADGSPYVLEDRWIDCALVPDAAAADFARRSPNEWLVENVPFVGGDLALSAAPATAAEAEALGCDRGAALFSTERRTHDGAGRAITLVRLAFAPGYRMRLEL